MSNDNKLRSELLNTALGIIVSVAAVFVLMRSGALKNDYTNTSNANVAPPIDINAGDININSSQDETDFDKFLTLRATGKCVSLYPSSLVSPSFTSDNQGENNKRALDFLSRNSKSINIEQPIDGGYLYVKAGTGSPLLPLSGSQSVYVYLGSMGGHLFRPASLVNKVSEDGVTQYLYRLEDIKFTHIPYSDNNTMSQSNWLSLINNNTSLYSGAFVSTVGRGELLGFEIAYSGKGKLEVEGGSDCVK